MDLESRENIFNNIIGRPVKRRGFARVRAGGCAVRFTLYRRGMCALVTKWQCFGILEHNNEVEVNHVYL